jgi:superfamily II DNA or RNA helicase
LKVKIDSLAWIQLSDLDTVQTKWLTDRLTLVQKVSKEYATRSTPAILSLFKMDKDNGRIGIPREFFFEKLSKQHDIEYCTSDGVEWPDRIDPVEVDGKLPEWANHRAISKKELTFFDTVTGKPAGLINDQPEAVLTTLNHLQSRKAAGGIIQAPTGSGKTIISLAMIKELRLKTIVLVHRQFLANQWKDRINQFLPDAKVGFIGGAKWKVEGCHIVIALIETLASWAKNNTVRSELSTEFGLVILDEQHRAGAPGWSQAIPLLHASKRIGISARPKRSDGLENAFLYHTGPVIFKGSVLRLTPKIRRVWTDFKINNERINPNFMSKELAVRFMTKNVGYNTQVVNQIKQALIADRKILVYSHSLDHLKKMKEELDSGWTGKPMVSAYFVGGMKEAELNESAKANVIFATFQMAVDSLDIPPLDTVVLATPIRNPEQCVGRILRPFAGKKDPVVVDMRADEVYICKDYGQTRDKFYDKLYSAKPTLPLK